ncbi:14.7 kDa ribonuclease H-like protein [bacterium BMS3Bbin07]|nr:14.7 kDa ribonuclease H-like protein [bacterium BMS3Bbin07]
MKTKKSVREAIIFSDGASSGNPGPAGIGVVVIIGDKKITLSEPIGNATNNVAEYRALIRGLETALKHRAEALWICLDSELIVRQLTGLYRVKNEGLIPLYKKVRAILEKFKGYNITHIPRAENSEADSLAKKAVQRVDR